jgi:hypothetical protein
MDVSFSEVECIQVNETLRELDIGNIELDTVGLISLATSLAVNKQITYINLESPQILDNQVNYS